MLNIILFTKCIYPGYNEFICINTPTHLLGYVRNVMGCAHTVSYKHDLNLKPSPKPNEILTGSFVFGNVTKSLNRLNVVVAYEFGCRKS